ncbi:hypothetical protein M0805_009780 [Coniferiporia weirii]|nr:hypothetical protein M0805_009780 [Coniferiporia weirii]
MYSVLLGAESTAPTIQSQAGVLNIDICSQVAIATLLAYDTLITMNQEVKYFWSTPGKFVSIIYFTNRYIGLLSAFVEIWGVSIAWIHAVADTLTMLLIDFILLMRVFALFSYNRKVVVCLGSLFGVEVVLMLSIVIYSVAYEKIGVGKLVEGITACGMNHFFPSVWGTLFWGTPLTVEAILLSLSLYKASHYWRVSAGLGGATLIKVLLQDQAIYFFLVMVCSIENIRVVWSSSSMASDYSYALSSVTFPCIVGSRLLVHLREAMDRGEYGGTTCVISSNTMSDMEFA